MKLFFDNIDFYSTSGPNHFGSKLAKSLVDSGVKICSNETDAEANLCFIQTNKMAVKNPMVLRLDGIYFNTRQDFVSQNENIKRTYEMASGVIFQSQFNKSLTTKYFGECENSIVIRNGADVSMIKNTKPIETKALDRFDDVWCCASSWRPHKRLDENVRYFIEHSSERDCLIVAGNTDEKFYSDHDRVFYVGNLPIKHLIALYKRSKYFLHLAWLDHCPNVVVDARAAGCQIVCSSAGGTVEVAGLDAIVVSEQEWNMKPIDLYDPPKLQFDKIVKNVHDHDYNINNVADEYKKFIGSVI